MEHILFEEENGVGLVILNRPKALNALSFEMITGLYAQLQLWEKNDDIRAIYVKGAGDKAFCAGGDIRAVYEAKKQGLDQELLQFYRDEYRLNQYISKMKTPYISMLNGITMGGGAGISIHGKYRIATERLMFAMPETSIGFFPDVGGSFFLNRCHDHIGSYLGLTGARLGAADCLEQKIVTHYMKSDKVSDFEAGLLSNWSNLDELLEQFCEIPDGAFLPQKKSLIDKCFDKDSVEDILVSLKDTQDEWALGIYRDLLTKSPLSLKVTHRQLLSTKNCSLEDGLKVEYRLATRFMESSDFFEGVRALIVDKDKNPKWQPHDLQSLSKSKIHSYFASLEEDEFSLVT
jgi:enoyl-CoA hydratase/carnithine racemase